MRLHHKFMEGLNRPPEHMKVLQHGCQTGKKVITRESMNARIYYVNYNTFKKQRRFCVATQWGQS
jgi:hypothetical protein